MNQSNSKNQKKFESGGFVYKTLLLSAVKILKLGNRKIIELEDLYALGSDQDFWVVFERFNNYYIRKQKKGYSFKKSLILWFLPKWMLIMLLFISGEMVTVAFPFLLRELINWVDESDDYKGFLIIAFIFVLLIIRPFLVNHNAIYGYRTAIGIHIIFFGMYFNKLEKISFKNIKYLNVNKITNSLTTDIQHVCMAAMKGRQILFAPFLIIIYLSILFFEIQELAFLSLGFLAIIIFGNILISKKIKRLSRSKFKFADLRNRVIKGFIEGIKAVKYNAWEKVLYNQINKLRLKERRATYWILVIEGLVNSMFFILPIICSLSTIILLIRNETDLDIGSIFFIIFIFSLMAQPVETLFLSVNQIYEGKLAIERIEDTLKYPNRNREENIKLNSLDVEKGEVQIRRATFSYDQKELVDLTKRKKSIDDEFIEPVLSDINITIKSGSFCVVVGEVGCGKTSFLKAIMKSLFINRGEVQKNGAITYIPQEGFVSDTTFKENIIFGKEFIPEVYNEILDICELIPDVMILKHGDETRVGDNGVSLSDGQKQRINIARSLYFDSDIYLIDNCLSGLDINVSNNIFKNVYKKYLKSKTRIIVTNNVGYMEQADSIIFLEKGRLIERGTFPILLKRSPKFKQFVEIEQFRQSFKNKHSDLDENVMRLREEAINSAQEYDKNFSDPVMSPTKIFKPLSYDDKAYFDTKVESTPLNINQLKTDRNPQQQFIRTEIRFVGQVDKGIYYKYFKKGVFCLFVINLLIFMIGFAGRITADYWIGSWDNKFNLSERDFIVYFIVLVVLTFLVFVIVAFTWAKYASTAAYCVFNDLLNLLMKKKISFFEATPIGQIINLTSKDTNDLDLVIPINYISAFSMLFQILGIFVLIGFTNPLLFILIVIIIVFSYITMRIFLNSSVELRRLELISFSSIISGFFELYSGLIIFRSYNRMKYMRNKYIDFVNEYLQIYFTERYCHHFIALILELMIAIFIGITLLIIVIGKIKKWGFVQNNIEVIALSLNWILILPQITNFFLFRLGEIAKGMSSIQRLFLNISDKDTESLDNYPKPNKHWPAEGSITAKNVSIEYGFGLPLVLNNISFDIRSGEKIGIVGKTGSGKTAFIPMLTRVLEPRDPENSFIKIDGVDISKVGLHLLRKKVMVISQKPLLFNGTLRVNIDPFNMASDFEIVAALRKTLIWNSSMFKSLKTYHIYSESGIIPLIDDIIPVIQEEDKLGFRIENNGENLSVGQKQQICIARALIFKPKILVMDEASSNVDLVTDIKMQVLLRREFKDSTIITIAHRLSTVIQYDRVFVLEQGKLIEKGEPIQLLYKNSAFSRMVKEYGIDFEEKMKLFTRKRKESEHNLNKKEENKLNIQEKSDFNF